MLLSTITCGGHYFVDLFAGTLLAVVGWTVGLAVAAWRSAALAMLRPARPQA
jgi:membrane-associated phospholipid phosphatase